MIQYPVSLPTSAGIARITLKAKSTVAMTRSPFSGVTQVQEHQAQWWIAEIELPTLLANEAREWHAFLLSLRGRFGTFTMGDPLGTRPAGSARGLPVVAGANQTGYVLRSRGWNSHQEGALRAGDYLQLGGDGSPRLHKVLQDVNSDSLGNADIDIWPRLRYSPADGSLIHLVNPLGQWRLQENEAGLTWEPPFRGKISFNAVEAL